MNNIRRKALQKISDKIVELKDELENIMQEEEEYRDNMPENLQGSERYEKTDDACNSLYDAVSQLEEVVSSIDAATE